VFAVYPEMLTLLPAVAGYLIVGVLLIGLSREHLPQVLALLWFGAVALLLVILIHGDPPGDWFLPLAASVLYGSLAFIGWVGFGGVIWRLLEDPLPRT
jgi:hypothetical protein